MAKGRPGYQLPLLKNPADSDGVLLARPDGIKRQPFEDFLDRVADRIAPPQPANQLAGRPVIADPEDGDLLQLKSGAWTNIPQENLVDGGNF